jgi:hypothetical protein
MLGDEQESRGGEDLYRGRVAASSQQTVALGQGRVG